MENTSNNMAADVRKKMCKSLLEEKANPIGVAGLVMGFIIASLLNLKGFWFIVPILVAGGFAYAVAERYHRGKLEHCSDAMLQLLYEELQKKERRAKLLSNIGGLVVVVIVGGILMTNKTARSKVSELINSVSSDASCQIHSHKLQKDLFIIRNDSDFGYLLAAKVYNAGKTGAIYFKAELTTSEGEYQRSQKMEFAAGEVRTLYFQFPEPTINATNVRYTVSCSPKISK